MTASSDILITPSITLENSIGHSEIWSYNLKVSSSASDETLESR
jgi:hypothetical protein